MRHGRYERRTPAAKHGRHAKKRKLNKSFLVTLSILLVLGLAVGGTIAYLIVNGGQVTNAFTPGNVACSVDSDGDITNTGNVDAYIRAAVVVNWVDSDGNVYAIAPNASISANQKNGWIQVEQYYYYVASLLNPDPTVKVDDTIPNPVIVSVNENENPDATKYHLEIDVVAEAIQAEGKKDSDGTLAVIDAWKITIPSTGN